MSVFIFRANTTLSTPVFIIYYMFQLFLSHIRQILQQHAWKIILRWRSPVYR